MRDVKVSGLWWCRPATGDITSHNEFEAYSVDPNDSLQSDADNVNR